MWMFAMKNAPKFRAFKRSDSGATAVEFAMIAPMLLLIFMAIVELSLMFFATVNLDGAAIEAARRIRTGQTQSTGNPEADFQAALCDSLNAMISCGQVYYDSRVMNSYSGITLGIQYDPDTGEPVTYGFSSGGAKDIVVVRVMYFWTFITPWIGTFFEQGPGSNTRLLTSSVVFQNEPY